MKRLLLIFFLLSPNLGFAQVKGMWHGFINSKYKDLNSNYVLIIEEEKDGVVKGCSYIYRQNYLPLFAKLKFVGSLVNNKLQITETDLLLNFTPITNEDFCFKSSDLKLSIKDSSEYLIGNWDGILASKDRCIPGEVFLKRTNLSDVKLIPSEILEQVDKEIIAADTFLKRGIFPSELVTVKSKTITINVKDYEVIDNDIISVYFNGKKIIDESRLRRKSLFQTIKLNQYSNLNELIIYAHNLGKIPPNTCMMIVDDGIKKQSILIKSSLDASASILIRYDE
jgi:hypothetical protein